MKQFVPFLLLVTSLQLFAQGRVEWGASYNANERQIIVTGHIDEGWHIYSQYQDEEMGPVATAFSVEYGDTIIEKLEEPKPVVKEDENFGGEVMYLEGSPQFTFDFPSLFFGKVTIEVVYMTCNEEGCLPPTLKKIDLIIKEDE